MKAQLRFLWALLATNIRASMALRLSFIMLSLFMAVNNLLFFIIWWVLFDRFEEINGWRLPDMAALFGIAAAGYGLSVITAGGVPGLSRRIDDGALDPMLTLPKSVLVQAACAQTRPAGWGDVLSGLFLIGLASRLSPWAVVAVLCSAVTFTAAGIAMHSAAFYARRIGPLASQAQEFLLAFSAYPPSLFGSTLKLVLFTVLPAGFATYLPAEILRAPTPQVVASAMGGSTACAVVAIWLFRRGLRRYASGNRFDARL